VAVPALVVEGFARQVSAAVLLVLQAVAWPIAAERIVGPLIAGRLIAGDIIPIVEQQLEPQQ
jgi:hypothetical protein